MAIDFEQLLDTIRSLTPEQQQRVREVLNPLPAQAEAPEPVALQENQAPWPEIFVGETPEGDPMEFPDDSADEHTTPLRPLSEAQDPGWES